MITKSPDRIIKESFEPLVKGRKAKNTLGCIYKKEGEYFWTISNKPYSMNKRRIEIGIKLWRYDELLCSITHPDEKVVFQDKLRWNGFSAMSAYQIKSYHSEYPYNTVTKCIDPDELEIWSKGIFEDSIEAIDSFIHMVEIQYGDLNEYHIANFEHDPLMAAFACISKERYQQAEVFLQIATERSLTFHRSYGSVNRDLRDVLKDYCISHLTGMKWTRDMVVYGLGKE